MTLLAEEIYNTASKILIFALTQKWVAKRTRWGELKRRLREISADQRPDSDWWPNDPVALLVTVESTMRRQGFLSVDSALSELADLARRAASVESERRFGQILSNLLSPVPGTCDLEDCLLLGADLHVATSSEQGSMGAASADAAITNVVIATG